VFYTAGALPAWLIFTIFRHSSADGNAARPLALQSEEAAETPTSQANLLRLFRSPALLSPLAFLFLYNAGPNYDDALYYYFITRLHFGPGFMGQLQTMHALAKVMGILWYRYFLHGADEERLMVKVTVMSLPLYLSPLLLTTGAYNYIPVPPQALALSGELTRELFLHLQLMPATAQWVRICPPGYEATLLSMLFSVISLSRAISKGTSAATASLLGVTAQDFSNLSVLVCICGASMLAPLSLSAFNLMPSKDVITVVAGASQRASGTTRNNRLVARTSRTFPHGVQLSSISEGSEESSPSDEESTELDANQPAPAG